MTEIERMKQHIERMPVSKEIIMSQSNLEDIICRLSSFKALLDAICKAMGDKNEMLGAMYSASDLIACICRDFQADIDCAEAVGKKVPA